jgi:hypothetical protein
MRAIPGSRLRSAVWVLVGLLLCPTARAGGKTIIAECFRDGAVQFMGNTFVSGAVLAQRLAVEDDPTGVLTGYYHSFGFYDVKVNRELVFSRDGREVVVIFHIDEGVRYREAEAPQVNTANEPGLVRVIYEIEESPTTSGDPKVITGNEPSVTTCQTPGVPSGPSPK